MLIGAIGIVISLTLVGLAMRYLRLDAKANKEKSGLIILIISLGLLVSSGFLVYFDIDGGKVNITLPALKLPDFKLSKVNLPDFKLGAKKEAKIEISSWLKQHYQVGEELDSGIYYLQPSNGESYVSFKVLNQAEDQVLFEGNNRLSSWIELKAGDSLYLTENTEITPKEDYVAQLTPQASYGEKEYYVGADLPAGEYYVAVSENSGSIVRYKDLRTGDEYNQKNSYLSYEGDGYIQLAEGDQVNLRDVSLQPVTDEFQSHRDYRKESGMYKVGTEIPEGSYYFSKPKENSSLVVYSGAMNFETKGTRSTFYDTTYQFLALKAGDYVTINQLKVENANQGPRFKNNSKIERASYLVGETMDAGWYQVTKADGKDYAEYDIRYFDQAGAFHNGLSNWINVNKVDTKRADT